MTTAILKVEVQTRIDAITYTSGTLQATEVLQLSVDTVGLELDLTNIIAVHTSISSAIIGGTSEDDLTAINASSIALGITSRGGEGKVLLPLSEILIDNLDLQLITFSGAIADTNSATFWDVMGNPDSIELGWQGDVLQQATDTNEQTVIDESGEGGVVANVVSSVMSGSGGKHTIRVTVDGILHTFISPLHTGGLARFILGYIGQFSPGTTSSFPAGINARGFSDLAEQTGKKYWLPNPVECLQFGMGLPYEDSVKVTIQSESNPISGIRGKVAVLRTSFSPKGLF